MTDAQGRAAGGTPPQPGGHAEPEPIQAIRLRHPWRTVFATIIGIVVILFV